MTSAYRGKVVLLEKTMVATLVAILVVLPFHAFLSTWLGDVFDATLLLKSWKEVLLLLAVPFVGLYLYLKPAIFKTLISRRINQLILVYFLLTLTYALASKASSEAVLAGLLMNLRFFAIFLLAQVVVESKNNWVGWIKRLLPIWLAVTAVILLLLTLLQVFVLPKEFLAGFGYQKGESIAPYILVDDNPTALRGFATMRGPNELGSYMILVLALAIGLIIKQRDRLMALAAGISTALAIGLSGSRSALLGAALAILMMLALSLPRKTITKLVRYGTAPLLIALIIVGYLAVTVPAIRLFVFHSSPGDPSLFEGSTQKHFEHTFAGVKDIVVQPLGSGVGTAGPASYYNQNASARISENYFVQLGQEVGILGLALFLAINVALVLRLWGNRGQLWPRVLLASFAGLTLVNMLLHGWVDDPTALTWWAVAGLYLVPTKKL